MKQMGLETSTPALGCAVAYPLGVVGVILAVDVYKRQDLEREGDKLTNLILDYIRNKEEEKGGNAS